MESQRRLSGSQIVTIVVALCAAAVLAPAGAIAASTLVNIADPTTGSRARVDAGKVRVGDGNGAFTVDGTVNTTERSAVVYKSPAGGLDCGANAAGVLVGNKDLSKYSKVRVFVKSGTGYQTIVQMRPVAGTEVHLMPWLDFTSPAGQYTSGTFYDPPSASELRIYFCNDAQIFIYGLK